MRQVGCYVFLFLLISTLLMGCGGNNGGSSDPGSRVRIVEWTFPEDVPTQNIPTGSVQKVQAGVQFELQPVPLAEVVPVSEVKFKRNGEDYTPTDCWTDENNHTFYRISERTEPFDYTVTGNVQVSGVSYPFIRSFTISP